MSTADLMCQQEKRRDAVHASRLLGVDYVEVSPDQLTLVVVFLGRAPKTLEKANIRIDGGRRIRDLQVVGVHVTRQRDLTLDDSAEIRVDRYGDFSTYTLSFVATDKAGHPTDQPLDGFDPRYASVDFTFKASCPGDDDCKSEPACPPQRRAQPDINYLAKDFASFRQLIFDRLALVMPDWRETHIPDIGVMLVDLLAYSGDYLSYYQDAVATEAYLATARQRISVRRHARLVDYIMHEGCNARAWVTIATAIDATLDPAKFFFCTPFPGAPENRTIKVDDLAKVPSQNYLTFQPLQAAPAPVAIHAVHSEIHFYTWGDCECCLPLGATAATLDDHPRTAAPEPEVPQPPPAQKPYGYGEEPPPPPPLLRALKLEVGDVLIFEEVIGPKTGNPADRDPTHRQAVRLTKVTPAIDPLYDAEAPGRGWPVLEIEWCTEDALTFPLCLSATMPPPDCSCRGDISVARGNVILVEHGTPVEEPIGTVESLPVRETCATDCAPAEIIIDAAPFRPVLTNAPLTFSEPLSDCCAGALLVQDPRRAVPRAVLWETPAKLVPSAPDPAALQWTAKPDLLESGGSDRDFVAEIDDDGAAHLRFGNGDTGAQPQAGSGFVAQYSVGNGPQGNVGAESIAYLVLRETIGGLDAVPRNPMPALGGTAAEPVAEVKMFAPFAFREVKERAIVGADYAVLAADNARRLASRGAKRHGHADDNQPFQRLQGATGALRWTGSWYEGDVALDPMGMEASDPALLHDVSHYLRRYRRVGHDLAVKGARYVGIDLALTVCVTPHALRAHVEAALQQALGAGALPDGRLGFFHPDNLGFGGGIAVSRIIAAAQAIQGVMEVQVTRLARLQVGAKVTAKPRLPAGGVLRLAPFEIARLDSDPSFPEHGRLTLDMRGGR